jgi:hypothetical protein
MGDCKTRCKPDHVLEEEEVTVEQPPDLSTVQGRSVTAVNEEDQFTPTIRTASQTYGQVPEEEMGQLTRQDRFKELNDIDEYQRLRKALTSRFIAS